MARGLTLVAGLALLASGAAQAQMSSFNGAEALARGDYASAERTIVAQQRLFPRDADLLLNLATVYAHTGRATQARQLYRLVLAQPDQRLELTADRASRSHALAQDGLARLPAEEVAAR